MTDAISLPRTAGACVGAVMLVVLSACAGQRAPVAQQPTASAGSVASPADSVQPGLRPGDALVLRAWREPDLSDTLRVGEGGEVVFPLLGRRNVTGVPPDSLERRVAEDYGEYVKGQVEVTLVRRVAVLGAVRRPGMYPLDLTHSVADAIARAGGPTPNADRSDIRLVRGDRVIRESLERTGRLADMPIRSGDQIHVGERGWFARNWQWVAGSALSLGTSILVITTR